MNAVYSLFGLGMLLSINAAEVNADGLRCDDRLVEIGDVKSLVLLKCGEPIMKDSYCLPVVDTRFDKWQRDAWRPVLAAPVRCEMWDEWTYHPGPGRFLSLLRFKQGELISLEDKGRAP
jgi:hypothetical protein